MITRILKRNHRILEGLIPEESDETIVALEKLLHRGFSLRYITHSISSADGPTIYCCYNYGYARMENDKVVIMKIETE